MKRLLVAVAINLWINNLQAATVDLGGGINPRLSFLNSLRNYPRQMELPTYCHSACTMALMLPQSCISPNHILYFHGAHNLSTLLYSIEGTNTVIQSYHLYPKLQNYLNLVGAMKVLLPQTPIDGIILHSLGIPFCGPGATHDK